MTTQPNTSVSYDSSTLSTRDFRRFATGSHRERAMKRVLGMAVAQPPGRNRVEHNYPERILHGRVEPTDTNVQSEFVAHFGPAVQMELARWLALRGDVRLTLGGRDSAATGIPCAKPKPAQSTPLPDKWRRLKPGREVTIRLDDVGSVEGRDGPKNGFLIGAVPGAVAGGLSFLRPIGTKKEAP